MRLPQRKSEQNRKHDAGDNFITPQKLQELKDELKKIEQRIRPRVVVDLTAAREMGDLSENAAYSHAKGKLMGLDRRIHELKEKIKYAVLIEPGGSGDGKVCLGCQVKVLVNGREKTFTITGSQETDPGNGRISHTSPVGSALLGLSIGDCAIVQINDREVEYEIIEVN